ncbi:MAG: ABC transporter permease [Candidatus Pacearchaeota archaeon]
MILDYFKLALGNLRHRGIRSWLTILGIFIGIAAVVALISMGAGLKSAVIGQFGALSVDKLTIQNKGTGFGPPGSTVVEKLNNHDIQIIENVRRVDLVIPRLIRIAKVEYNKIPTYTYITDLPDTSKKMDLVYESFNVMVSDGRLLRPDDSGKILIGADFAKTKTFEKDLAVGKNIQINGKDFQIIGILEKSSSLQLNNVILMPTKDLQELLGIKDEWDLIVAQVHDKNKIQEVAKDIENALRKDRNEKIGGETFSVQTPLQALGAVNTILNIINAIVVGIAMISLVVGGVGIANTMYTSVIERTKEIGIMKAIGAKNKDILWIFLIESGLLGLVGGIVGALIGLGGAIGISNIANSALGNDLFKVTVSYPLLFAAISFSFILGIIFGVFPALQASKLKPVEALRK